jgi:hypothetical protein
MKTSKSITGTIISGIALFLAAIAPASADRVFPPPHLSPDAVFEAGTIGDTAVEDAWYLEAGSDRRASLKDNETQESSPYPSSYYFARAHVFPPPHINDGSVEYRSTERRGVVKVADEGPITDDNS